MLARPPCSRQGGRVLAWTAASPVSSRHAPAGSPNLRRASVVRRATADGRGASVLKYKDEITFNLNEYMVVLDKPLGLTLAPDPATGQIVVQHIKENSPAASCHLIQVGDVVRKCSAVFGEDMWQAIDIRRMRWAINNRTSKVKLVLERARRPLPAAPVWYAKGQVGRASFEREALQLPVSFVSASGVDDWTTDLATPGKPLVAGFHRSSSSTTVPLGARIRPLAARTSRLQVLRAELAAAHSSETVDVTLPPVRRQRLSRSSECQSVSGCSEAQAAVAATPSGAPSSGDEPRPIVRKSVLPFLPWLLLTSERLSVRELTVLATKRGLGSVLELSLTLTPGGHLAIKGADGLAMAEMNVSSLMGAASDDANGDGVAPGDGRNEPPENGTQAATGRSVVPRSSLDGREGEISLLLQAAACLQRLSFRRVGSAYHNASKERCAVLLHCEEGVASKCGNLLAGWLHWFCAMPLQEAILSAELSTGTVVQQDLLEQATEHLIRLSDDRMNRVTLTWKYGSRTVAVAGDIVGGWQNHVSMRRCNSVAGCKGSTARGHFFLPLTGIKPGIYFYKYIVDGTWTVDQNLPRVIDASGNYNNVLEVHPRPPSITTRERLQMARWQAAHLALDCKMRPAAHQ